MEQLAQYLGVAECAKLCVITHASKNWDNHLRLFFTYSNIKAMLKDAFDSYGWSCDKDSFDFFFQNASEIECLRMVYILSDTKSESFYTLVAVSINRQFYKVIEVLTRNETTRPFVIYNHNNISRNLTDDIWKCPRLIPTIINSLHHISTLEDHSDILQLSRAPPTWFLARHIVSLLTSYTADKANELYHLGLCHMISFDIIGTPIHQLISLLVPTTRNPEQEAEFLTWYIHSYRRLRRGNSSSRQVMYIHAVHASTRDYLKKRFPAFTVPFKDHNNMHAVTAACSAQRAADILAQESGELYRWSLSPWESQTEGNNFICLSREEVRSLQMSGAFGVLEEEWIRHFILGTGDLMKMMFLRTIQVLPDLIRFTGLRSWLELLSALENYRRVELIGFNRKLDLLRLLSGLVLPWPIKNTFTKALVASFFQEELRHGRILPLHINQMFNPELLSLKRRHLRAYGIIEQSDTLDNDSIEKSLQSTTDKVRSSLLIPNLPSKQKKHDVYSLKFPFGLNHFCLENVYNYIASSEVNLFSTVEEVDLSLLPTVASSPPSSTVGELLSGPVNSYHPICEVPPPVPTENSPSHTHPTASKKVSRAGRQNISPSNSKNNNIVSNNHVSFSLNADHDLPLEKSFEDILISILPPPSRKRLPPNNVDKANLMLNPQQKLNYHPSIDQVNMDVIHSSFPTPPKLPLVPNNLPRLLPSSSNTISNTLALANPTQNQLMENRTNSRFGIDYKTFIPWNTYDNSLEYQEDTKEIEKSIEVNCYSTLDSFSDTDATSSNNQNKKNSKLDPKKDDSETSIVHQQSSCCGCLSRKKKITLIDGIVNGKVNSDGYGVDALGRKVPTPNSRNKEEVDLGRTPWIYPQDGGETLEASKNNKNNRVSSSPTKQANDLLSQPLSSKVEIESQFSTVTIEVVDTTISTPRDLTKASKHNHPKYHVADGEHRLSELNSVMPYWSLEDVWADKKWTIVDENCLMKLSGVSEHLRDEFLNWMENIAKLKVRKADSSGKVVEVPAISFFRHL